MSNTVQTDHSADPSRIIVLATDRRLTLALFTLPRLELGSGIGLVGLGVLLGCGVHAKMLITDQLEMLELMKLNIERNEVQSQASALILNWCVS